MALTYGQTLMYPEFEYGRMIEGRFRECLGGCAACGLLRKNVPQSSDRNQTLNASVFGYISAGAPA